MSAEDEVDKDTPAETPSEETPAAKDTKAASEPQAAEETSAAEETRAAEKTPAAEETPAAERKPAAKKAPSAKGPAAESKPTAEEEAPEEDAPEPDGQKDALKAPAKRRAARKAASAKAAAPGDTGEAQEAAKAQDAAKPSKKLGRRAGASLKAKPTRRVVRAHARYVRTSARKARMVCGHLRGKSIQEARAILAFTPRDVARDWSKLLESAVANAENNHELLEDDLIVREAYADEGPTIKRFRPRAMGRATPIRKRTSHLTITLTPGSPRTTNK
jgi:ribosomal protein L22